jgi:nicotinamidase-related amidase
MSAMALGKQSAMVVLDLQKGILAPPALLESDDIKTRARRLVAAFRAMALPVVRVKLLVLDQLGAQPRWAALPNLPPVRRLVLSSATTPRSAVALDRMTTAATQPDSRVAHPDVIVPGWCREAAGPQ